jgi:hypothetical protein
LATKTASKRALDRAAFSYAIAIRDISIALMKPLQLVVFPNERRYAT